MKHPKYIYVSNIFNASSIDEYSYYKFNKEVYKDCYEYIHFWRNGSGKWKCFKCYLEKGNHLYAYYKMFLSGKYNNSVGSPYIFSKY